MYRTSTLLVALLASGCAPSVLSSDAMLAAGTNRAFAHTVRVQAPPDSVWRLWTEVERWPDWDSELEHASLKGPFEQGARGRLVPVEGQSSSFRITELDVGRSYTFETKLPLSVLRIERSWVHVDSASVDITHAVSFHGVLGGVFARRFGPRFRQALPIAMERIRQLAEAAP
ncbi:MAG: SRPBCC family protein [Bacteroidota bacterium]